MYAIRSYYDTTGSGSGPRGLIQRAARRSIQSRSEVPASRIVRGGSVDRDGAQDRFGQRLAVAAVGIRGEAVRGDRHEQRLHVFRQHVLAPAQQRMRPRRTQQRQARTRGRNNFV